MSPKPQKGQHHGRRHRGRRKPTKEGPRREHVAELHPLEDAASVDSFLDWDLGEEIQRAIRNMDISVPTPIQGLTIGPVLEGRDVIAKAETGTGKTLAFGAPMMARIDPARATVLGLVLCPTRELAQQVCDVLAALALPRGVRVALVVGGDPMHPQISALQGGAQIVVGTPGRVLDLYQQRFLSFPWTEYVVLDEADKMFEIGFLDDIKRILSYMPDERQTLLFSATFPTEVLKLARAETKDPLEVATARGTATVDAIAQSYMEVPDEDRPLILTRLLENSADDDVFLVFCERRTDVDRLFRRLERLPFGIKALHGGYDQAARFRVMSAFRTGEVKALLATDVASRGLDVQHVSHVLNFSVPRELEDYTHRIGRTGRAGRSGTAITFVTPADRRRWRALQSRAPWEIEETGLPERGGGRRRRNGSPPRPGARRPDERRREPEREPRRDRQERRPSRQREKAESARPAAADDFGAIAPDPTAPPQPAQASTEGDEQKRRRRPRGRSGSRASKNEGRDGGRGRGDGPDAFGAGL